MRDYGRVAPTFWTRGSGKKLRGNPRAQIVALYLFTSPASTMIGIYHLAIPTMAHETGLTPDEAERALADVVALDVARYDPEEELVYLPEGARYQIGESLKPGDKRVAGIRSALAQFSRHPFALDFARRYAADFCLGSPPEDPPSKVLPTEPEAPSKPLPRGGDEASMPLGSQARQEAEQAITENSPPPAGARAHETKVETVGFSPVETPPSPPREAPIVTAEDLLAAVARHSMLVTLHGDRKWAQNVVGALQMSACRAEDAAHAVDAFVTREASRSPDHAEALDRFVRDRIGGYLTKAKQYGDEARNRARRETERAASRPSGPRGGQVLQRGAVEGAMRRIP